ncbi:HEAT repeat-containing protein 1 [Trichonephila inaurata madagascariensis]|uniref:HEAT repeat-containing protein 1 n=1 Tax=Trichonephila inaurata madagascariensis TaxID=2747483 RepID=A0A8X6YBP6_9ARAC|nr:HEAT repeat-containing protein 1 [Trichonephila inaurata madagascariensis]
MASTTSLQRQLKKLAAPQTDLYNADKIRKSFLFDFHDAASLDRDVVFAYGTNGLEKLKIMNSVFAKFEENLFHLSYKVFERSVQSASINKKLDELITEFLRMLSPYFLDKAAHEALEWLVYAFHIHVFNTDELVASALPYFNTSVFVRVVQLLNVDDPCNRWHWLKSVQETGTYLEYSALLNHMNTDAGFLKFVCDLADKSIMIFQNCESCAVPVVSFSMVSLYNALEMKKKLNNSVIVSVLPYLVKALESNLKMYIISAYMIISSIFFRVKLQESIIISLLTKVFKNINPDVAPQAYRLLLLTFQQQPIKIISLDLFRLIAYDKSCRHHLNFLAESFEATSLVLTLSKKSFPLALNLILRKPNSKKCTRAIKFCYYILNSVALSERNVSVILNVILKTYLTLQVKSKIRRKKQLKLIQLFLKRLDKNYPAYFNKAIDRYFKKKPQESSKLYKIINSISRLQNKIVPDIKTTLVLGINHTNTHVRMSSIKYLLQYANSGKCSDEKFIENSLCDRFYDDSPDVIMEMLSSPEILLRFVNKENLLIGFEKILKKIIRKDSEWYQVQMRCLYILCNFYANEKSLSFNIFYILLPFIFPLQEASLKGFYRIINSNLRRILPVLRTLKIPNLSPNKKCLEGDVSKIEALNFSIISSVKKYINHTPKRLFLTFLAEKCTEVVNYPLYTIFTVAAGHAIISSEKLNEKSVWIGKLLKFFKSLSSVECKKSTDVQDLATLSEHAAVQKYVEALIKREFPRLIIHYTFYNVVKQVNFSKLDNSSWPFVNEDKFLTFSTLTHLYEFCVNDDIRAEFPIFNMNYLPSEFLHLKFPTDQDLFSFLSLLWSNSCFHIPQCLQISALNSAIISCSASKTFDWFFDNDFLCISLLKALSSDDLEVRRKSFSLLEALIQHSENSNSALNILFQYLYENSVEICIDHKQFYFALKEWINPVVDMYMLCGPVRSNTSADISNQYSVLHLFIKNLLDDNTPNFMKWFILVCLNEIDSSGILLACIPLMRKFLMLQEKSGDSIDELSLLILSLLFQQFTPKTAICLKEDCIETETFFKYFSLIEKGFKGHKYIMKNLTRDFFMAIPSVKVQQRLFHVLLGIYVNSSDCTAELKKVLLKLSTFAYLILKDLQFTESTQENITLRALTKLKLKEKGNMNECKTKELKKIIILLELIQNKSKLDKRELLIPELFNLLEKTLSFNSESLTEYVKQLILSTIHNCCQNLGTVRLDERQFQVELIVKCIRSSTNPETHRQALLLLNLSAIMFPDYVLNSVMSIFVFMGSSLIRQDDSYSFQVISQTIETIVPSLLAASKAQKENDTVQIVASVIRVFVDSLCHIPKHRQMPLFYKLISNLEPSKYLWIPLAEICDQYSSVEDVLEFAVNLHKQFCPSVQIDTCIALLDFLCLLPDNKEKTPQDFIITEPFNVSTHSNEQLQKYKYDVLSYINIWILSQTFVSEASELNSQTLCILEEKYEVLLEKAMKFLHHLRSLDLPDANENSYRNSLLPLLFDLVSRINCLLPSNLFIKIAKRLLQSSEVVIQKKATELLIDKLTTDQDLSDSKNPKMLLKLLKPLLRTVENCGENFAEENSESVRQSALYALHLLTKVIGSTYPSKFIIVLNVSVQILKDNQNEALTINALLCLAQVCHSLGMEVLPFVNSFMPVVVDFLVNYSISTCDDNLILGIIATLHRLIEDLGAFLSKYLGSIIIGICMLHAKKFFNKKVICENLQKFQTLLATNISLRSLLPAVVNSYSEIMATNCNAILPLVEILKEKLNDCKFVETEECFVQMEQFFLILLDFRNLSESQEFVSDVESTIISALIIYIKKLPVTHFKAYFQKMYVWATATENKIKLRLFTFYNVTNHLSNSLKHLFLVVAKHFLKHAASELDSNNSSKSENIDFGDDPVMLFQYLSNILDTLTICCLNDNHCLFDKDTFEFLMQPLVDQLENLSVGEKAYQEMISNHLSPCIAQFMASVTDNTLWKKLNYQILLKTRNDSPMVRFAAIQVIREVTVVMENNYLPLLPESIPFLAEVMEDESSEVEKECQSVITEMERILGEPIRKYF